jgi:hypothetical protein
MLQQCDLATRFAEPHVPAGEADARASWFRITGVEVRQAGIVIRIGDSGPIEWPLRRIPVVARAQPQARRRWELTDDGTGLNWPKLAKPQPYGLLSVWEVLQEQLLDDALARGFEVGWNLGRLCARDAELVALWRLTMDLVFGSYLQFRCSWDATTARLAREALLRAGASAMAGHLEAMEQLADAHGAPRDIGVVAYVPALMRGSGNERLQDLEAAFWEEAVDLPRRVVETHYDVFRPRRTRSQHAGGYAGSSPRTAAS